MNYRERFNEITRTIDVEYFRLKELCRELIDELDTGNHLYAVATDKLREYENVIACLKRHVEQNEEKDHEDES